MNRDEIAAAIRMAEDSRMPSDPDLRAKMAGGDMRLVEALVGMPIGRGAPLTRREQQVGELITEGLTNEEIAEQLGINVESVKTFVRRVLPKLGAKNRSHAAAKLARTRLIKELLEETEGR